MNVSQKFKKTVKQTQRKHKKGKIEENDRTENTHTTMVSMKVKVGLTKEIRDEIKVKITGAYLNHTLSLQDKSKILTRGKKVTGF